jgi:calcium permeable stress-gated cation channel
LDIGKVESVMLVKNWKELDDTMVERMTVLRKLEEAWTVHLGHRRVERSLETLPISQPAPPGPSVNEEDREDSTLLASSSNGPNGFVPYARSRPVIRIWHGPLKLRYRPVDAINYYEEKLRRLDEQIKKLRKKDFEPCNIAFITMDSVAACQMAVQAVLDSSPLQLLANASPSPADVVWPNTYMPRPERMTRAWSITAFIVILTLFWSVVLAPIAGLVDLDRIHSVWPALADFLDSQPLAKSLVQTQLPTLVISLLNILVPFLYDCKRSSLRSHCKS